MPEGHYEIAAFEGPTWIGTFEENETCRFVKRKEKGTLLGGVHSYALVKKQVSFPLLFSFIML